MVKVTRRGQAIHENSLMWLGFDLKSLSLLSLNSFHRARKWTSKTMAMSLWICLQEDIGGQNDCILHRKANFCPFRVQWAGTKGYRKFKFLEIESWNFSQYPIWTWTYKNDIHRRWESNIELIHMAVYIEIPSSMKYAQKITCICSSETTKHLFRGEPGSWESQIKLDSVWFTPRNPLMLWLSTAHLSPGSLA